MGREEGQLRAGGLERLEGEIAFFYWKIHNKNDPYRYPLRPISDLRA